MSPSTDLEAPMPKHAVAVTLEEVFPEPREALFRFIVAEDVLPKVLKGYGPLPAVVGTRDVSGPWDRPGASRTVLLADGTTAREQVTAFEHGRHFAYRVSEFSFALRHLAHDANGRWWFSDEPGGGTRVRWTYTFHAHHAVARLPLMAFAHTLWRGYMQVCLDRTRLQAAP